MQHSVTSDVGPYYFLKPVCPSTEDYYDTCFTVWDDYGPILFDNSLFVGSWLQNKLSILLTSYSKLSFVTVGIPKLDLISI